MNTETLKKYLLFLDLIKKREITSPSSLIIEKDKEDPSQWWVVGNYYFGLEKGLFENFFSYLSILGVLEITNIDNVPSSSEEKGTDSHGNIYYTEELLYPDSILLSYINININKLKAYENSLSSLLTKQDFEDLQKKGTYLGETIKEAGKLKMHTGGMMSYDNSPIYLRTGLRNLCEVFIDRPEQMLNRDELEEGIGIHTRDKKSTVAKYVSALNSSLEPFFKKKPITNYKKRRLDFPSLKDNLQI